MNFLKKYWWLLVVGIVVLAGLVIVARKLAYGPTGQPRGQNTERFYQNADITDPVALGDAHGQQLSNGKCNGTDKPPLTTLPMRPQDFSMIIPYGLTVGGHVTPIDHQYFSPADQNSPRDAYPVYAMADATLVDLQPRTTPRGTEYRFVFSVSCKLFYYYDLVTSLAPEVAAVYNGERASHRVNLPVTAGQTIGYIGGQTLDFAVWDMDVVLPGFMVPEHYEGEPWKIHTADPLDYYTPEVRAQALAKYMRTVEPRSGKIDYDVDGRLVGNWFVEGSGGYAGLQGTENPDYPSTHLSIAPDHLDPTSIVFSIGDFAGEPAQFGVVGNAPDPAEMAVTDGLVTYELVLKDWADSSGQHWDRMTLAQGLRAANQTNVQGTALVQLLDDRLLKVEVFPGKTLNQVTGFTDAAVIYER